MLAADSMSTARLYAKRNIAHTAVADTAGLSGVHASAQTLYSSVSHVCLRVDNCGLCLPLPLPAPCSVTKQEIVDAIYQQTGRSIADFELEIPDIKALGTFECSVKLHPEVTGTFNVLIQREKNVQAKKK
jgi:hypothetical protein